MAPKTRTYTYTSKKLQEILERPSIGGVTLSLEGTELTINTQLDALVQRSSVKVDEKGRERGGNPQYAVTGLLDLSKLDPAHILELAGKRYRPMLNLNGFLLPVVSAAARPPREVLAQGVTLEELLKLF